MPAPEVSVRLLLVTDDLETINFLCHVLQRLAISVEICSDTPSAAGKLCRAKFEAVVIDFREQKAAEELVQTISESVAHKACIRFALLPASPAMERVADLPVHFSIRRPLSSIEVIRMFKAAYPMMVRERRRCFRAPVEVSVKLARVSGVSANGNTVNISEGGMAITSSAGLSVGEQVRITVHLPGSPAAISAHAEVCWTKDDRCGLQFCSLPSKTQEALQQWLAKRLDASLPERPAAEPLTKPAIDSSSAEAQGPKSTAEDASPLSSK